jgi:hypothetical protein
MNKLIGIVLVAGGVVLLVYGFQARDSLEDRVSSVFNSSSRNKTTLFLAGGAAATVAGIAMIVLKGKS